MKRSRCFFLLTATWTACAVCQAASITGSGSISFLCLQGFGPADDETLTSSAPHATLNTVCPAGFIPDGFGGLAYSASYQSLSVAASSAAYGTGAQIAGQVSFSDLITVLGPADGFLLVSGETQVSGSSDQVSFLNLGMSLNGFLFGAGYQDTRGQLTFSWAEGPVTHTYVDTYVDFANSHIAMTRQFAFFMPFTAGTPMALSGFMNVRTGGNTAQSMNGTLDLALSVVDGNLAPVGFSLESESGFFTTTPEPSGLVLLGPVLVLLVGRSSTSNRRAKSFGIP